MANLFTVLKKSIMKIGSVVRIVDGSYMMTQLPDGKISHFSKNIGVIGHNEDTWNVLLINIALPTERSFDGTLLVHNNCLIQNTINKELWFCSSASIREVVKIESNKKNTLIGYTTFNHFHRLCTYCGNKLCDSQRFNKQCFNCGKNPLNKNPL